MKDHFFTKTYLETFRIIGMVSIIVFLLNIQFDFLTSYLSGFTLSFGITILVLSSILLFNKSFMKESKIAEQDERLMMIRGKVMSTTFMIQYWGVVILIIVFGMIESTYMVSVTLAGFFVIEYIIMLILNIYYKRKY
ncbi:hypothetical protein [Paracholeplasma manati]|uniref:Uncharacterized protein n=1 Tax=Paracholeplasma manati TaxID=591373 RepID=A0ABT2Y6Q6_9MOLU|nr:hypothetical protein [Paracholeplasma manati]MCV2232433.1 hypothetical protein [Paracholeplasma manati]MDG0887981.1 hypothetical protein [Paracholeplasma manati]